MENQEIVMEELKKLPNLDENIYVEKGVWNKEDIKISAKEKATFLAHGSLKDLVHGIRAVKLIGLTGTIENVEKGLRVFNMLGCIYAYNRCLNAEEMASRDIFSEEMYNLDYESVKAMAQYLIDHTARVELDVYTDNEGCSYNSLEMVEV